jgi:hypothetical protein
MSERTLHKSVCDYIRLKYPHVLFNSDLSGATKLTLGQAVALKSLRSGRGFPDLAIYEPSKTGKYKALFIELKPEGTKLYNKSGFPATPHLAEQNEMISHLSNRGYYADFGVGLDACIKLIENYFNIL